MKKNDKLRVYWSKKEDTSIIHFPLGYETRCDAQFLVDIFNKEFGDTIESFGYDITTIKFSIEPMKGNDRFASQRNEGVKDEDKETN